MIEYLTTHDLVWINNTVTGAVHRFDYMALEAAMAAQYQYGDSRDVLAQSANLLRALLFRPPFAAGNRRTALIAVLTFLNANGFATKATDAEAAQLVTAVASGATAPLQAINELAAPAKEPLPANITLRQLITFECNHHVGALKILTEGDQ